MTIIARAGVSPLSPQDVRRTHSTLLIATGIDPATTAKPLGQRNAAITLDLSPNVTPDRDEAAAQAIHRIVKLA